MATRDWSTFQPITNIGTHSEGSRGAYIGPSQAQRAWDKGEQGWEAWLREGLSKASTQRVTGSPASWYENQLLDLESWKRSQDTLVASSQIEQLQGSISELTANWETEKAGFQETINSLIEQFKQQQSAPPESYNPGDITTGWQNFQPLSYRAGKSQEDWTDYWDPLEKEAKEAYATANTNLRNYLGGRTVGTPEEFAGWQDLERKVESATRDMDAIMSYKSQEAFGTDDAWYPDWWDGEKPQPLPENEWASHLKAEVPPGAPGPVPEPPIVDTSEFTPDQLKEYHDNKGKYQSFLTQAQNIGRTNTDITEHTPFRGVRVANWHDVDRGNVAQGVKGLMSRSGQRISTGKTGAPTTTTLSGWDNLLNLLPDQAQRKIRSNPAWEMRDRARGDRWWSTIKPHAPKLRGLKSGLNDNGLLSSINNWQTNDS